MSIKITEPGHYTVGHGDHVDVHGTGVGVVITMTGGEVRTWETSAPVIHMTGGKVRTRDTSAPVITQSGGVVERFDESQPVIQTDAKTEEV